MFDFGSLTCLRALVSSLSWGAGLYDEHPDFMDYYERFIGSSRLCWRVAPPRPFHQHLLQQVSTLHPRVREMVGGPREHPALCGGKAF